MTKGEETCNKLLAMLPATAIHLRIFSHLSKGGLRRCLELLEKEGKAHPIRTLGAEGFIWVIGRGRYES
jgi:hypothetical protein